MSNTLINLKPRQFLIRFIPRTFMYLIDNEKVKFNGENLKTSKLIDLIHIGLYKNYRNKKERIDDEIKFQLSSIIMKKRYGINYNLYMDYLIKNGFYILSSDYYNTGNGGGKARTYKIGRKHLINVKRVKLYDKILLNKYNNDYLNTAFSPQIKNTIPVYLRKKLANDLFDIKLDYKKASRILKKMGNDSNIDSHKYHINYMAVESINDGGVNYSFDEYGRMHTNFTRLKKDIRRNCLSIDGEELKEIDISNSQPLFLAHLMKTTLSPHELINPEFTRYFELVKNGFLYEEIMEKGIAKSKKAKELLKDRDKVKIIMYRVLFGKNGEVYKENQIFSSVFPDVFNFIKEYKSKLKNHRSLAHKLQNLESLFIYNKVITHILQIDPTVKMFTVHDSIVVPIKHYKKVKEIFDYYKNKII